MSDKYNFFLVFIKNILTFKSFVFQIKEKKFCIIENFLNPNLQNYLPKNKTAYISIYEINIFILFKLIFKRKNLFFQNFQNNYYLEAIKYYKCSAVFSMIDNNLQILQLKKFLPKVKFLVVQNGMRFKSDDYLRKKPKYQIDYYLTFNRYYSSILSQKIKSKFAHIGFIENNTYKIKKKFNKKKILYISEFDLNIFKNKFNNKKLKNYFRPERKLLPIVHDFCKKNNYQLFIFPRTSSDLEKSFYFNILKGKKFIYLNRNEHKSYNEIDSSMLVISMHSTLGYESLARGKKTAIFCGRTFFDKSRSFGWPKYNFNSKGFFWLNKIDEKKILKILENLSLMKNNIWLKKSKKYLNDICLYDYKNRKMRDIILKHFI